MPQHKNQKNPRHKDEDRHNNNFVQPVQNHNNHGGGQRGGNNNCVEHRMAKCCMPTECRESEINIDPEEPADAVKVLCNNENCNIGNWMHRSCFEEWEESVLSYLRSCGRARSWSEKQRLQNLWTKKGYDLAFKACDCKCGRGHLRKDLDYFPTFTPTTDNTKAKKKNKKKNDKPMPVVSTNHKAPHNQNHISNGTLSSSINHDANGNNPTNSAPMQVKASATTNSITSNFAQLRLRTDSVSSTGSSPPNSASSESPPMSSSPLNVNLYLKEKRFDVGMFHDHGSTGNIFRRRQDLSAFSMLPKFKQNPYYIKMEDEGPHGNDDTRSFVLSNLSSHKMTSMRCVFCKDILPVFDRYPLIDGTLFLSPQAYDEAVVQVIYEGRIQFMNAACVRCLDGHSDIKCASCKKKWDGSTFVLGTMYTYDIFAAMPCCQKRLTCKYCRRAVVNLQTGLNFYSHYSKMTICPYCKANDYHFIRPMTETFILKEPIRGFSF